MPSGLTILFTGLSAAGKTTLCQAVARELLARGEAVEILDGDVIRRHLSKGLGFSRADREENLRRITFVASLLNRHGVIVLVAAIAPYQAARDEMRRTLGVRFVEVYVNAPLVVCEARDPKGLYRRARAGELRGFTGIDDVFEPPANPDVECRTDQEPVETCVARILAAWDARALKD